MRVFEKWLLICMILSGALRGFSAPPESLGRVEAIPQVQVPERLFSDRVLEVARQYMKEGEKSPFFAATLWGDASRASKWIALPEESWADIISDHAPISLHRAGGKCPLCGKKFGGVRVDFDTPLSGRTICCKEEISARPEELPAESPALSNRVETIPLLDGSVHDYHFIVPAGAENSPERWLCPEGELWNARMKLLLLQVLPDLSARLILDPNDATAAETLASIFVRLAEAYPSLPFYDEKDLEGLLFGRFQTPAATAKSYQRKLDEWRAPLNPWEGALKGNEILATKLLESTGYGGGGRIRHVGTVAEAYDLLRHHSAMPVISQKLLGDPAALDRLVSENILQQMSAWAKQYVPFTGNQTTVWFVGSVKLAAVARDKDYLRKVAFYYDSYLRNHFFHDGLSIETAFNYSEMLGFLFQNDWIPQAFFGIDFSESYPLAERIHELGDYPVVTLLGLESMHADQHATFFSSLRLDGPGEKLDYSPVSQNFPDYGLTCLRAGAPGSRLELIMDYQNAVLHSHPARLNLQLFYQGVNLLPDLGYSPASVNGKAADRRFRELEYPFELEDPSDFGDDVEMHNTGTALGSQFGKNTVVFERYFGCPGSPLQMVQADGEWIYKSLEETLPDVNVFNRQVAALTLPNGRAVALDFFRMDGGLRHDIFWHAPAEATCSSLGEGRKTGTSNLMEYYNEHADPKPGWMREATYFYEYMVNRAKKPYFEGLRLFKNPVEWSLDSQPWTIKWTVDPARYAPVTSAGMEKYEPWGVWLTPVNLNIRGAARGTGAVRERLLGATAPWAGQLECGTMGSRSRIAFKDGFQALVGHRQGNEGTNLTSTFVHVLDPSIDEQVAAIASMDVREVDSADAQMGAVVDMRTAEGDRLLVGGSLSGGLLEDAALKTDGRLCMAMPDLATAALFDGTFLKTSGFEMSVSPMPVMTLVRVIGDLTGQPKQSALIVKADAPLPAGAVLAGWTVNVEHQSSEAHVSAYEIKEVSAVGEGLYRIDLAHTPPFIKRKLFVTSRSDSTAGVSLGISHHLHDGIGRPYGLNRNLLFPRSGFKSTIKAQKVSGYAGWWSDALTPADTPDADAVKVGDPMFIYSVQSGDRVVIPELVSCRPLHVENNAVLCEVFSTGSGSVKSGGSHYAVRPGSQKIKITTGEESSMKIKNALTTAALATAAALNATPAKAADLPEIQASFSFEGNASDYAFDSTGGSKAFITRDGVSTRVEGAVGTAIHLDGKSIVSVWKSKLSLAPGKAVSWWVNVDNPLGSEVHPYAPGIFTSNAEGNYDGFVTLSKKGAISQLVMEDDAGNPVFFRIPEIEPGTWNHFALSVAEDGAITCYFNGNKIGTQSSESGEDLMLSVKMIGRGYKKTTEVGGSLAGSLDEVVFYNRELTAEEVTVMANPPASAE